MRRILWLITALLLVGVFIGAKRYYRGETTAPQAERDAGKGGRENSGGQGNRPVPVVAADAVARDMPIYLRGLGNVLAFNTVTVKSRVDGQLMEVRFREGQDVREGDVLAIIDPRPFEVQLHQAQANLAKDQAQLADAKLNLGRYQDLFTQKVIARQQLDTQRATVEQFEGAIGADQAQVENAKLQLVYSKITSPITGRVGLRLVDPGNIIHASDANGLLVITQMEPIAVVFTLPEDTLPQVLRHMHGQTLACEAYSRDDATKIASGKLLTIDNEIDQTTGMYKLKGVFGNKDRQLWPSQFVNVWLLVDVRKHATAIPNAAVERGNQGTYVYVVKPDQTAEMRTVQVGFTEGNLAEIDKGLDPGEKVVVDGQEKLQPGAHVQLTP